MSNITNYATLFENQLKQKYAIDLRTDGLTTSNQNVRFVGTREVKIPYVVTKGFKDHGRGGGFNRQAVENRWITKELEHDRDIEMFVDVMDVDETNQVLAAANITNAFETEHAIPEIDSYRISKMYSEWSALGSTVDNSAITPANALTLFDDYMSQMDDRGVPEAGRILYVTPTVRKAIKQAEGVDRFISVGGGANGQSINRVIHSLDDVQIKPIPSARMKTAFDFTDGCVPGATAKQISMILVHPSAVIAVNKHSYIKLWPPGSHTIGDGYLYQNRKYWDLFVLDTRTEGIMINAAT